MRSPLGGRNVSCPLKRLDSFEAQMLGAKETAHLGAAHFRALGRFGEPRLRRALTILGEPLYGRGLLAHVEHATAVLLQLLRCRGGTVGITMFGPYLVNTYGFTTGSPSLPPKK